MWEQPKEGGPNAKQFLDEVFVKPNEARAKERPWSGEDWDDYHVKVGANNDEGYPDRLTVLPTSLGILDLRMLCVHALGTAVDLLLGPAGTFPMREKEAEQYDKLLDTDDLVLRRYISLADALLYRELKVADVASSVDKESTLEYVRDANIYNQLVSRTVQARECFALGKFLTGDIDWRDWSDWGKVGTSLRRVHMMPRPYRMRRSGAFATSRYQAAFTYFNRDVPEKLEILVWTLLTAPIIADLIASPMLVWDDALAKHKAELLVVGFRKQPLMLHIMRLRPDGHQFRVMEASFDGEIRSPTVGFMRSVDNAVEIAKRAMAVTTVERDEFPGATPDLNRVTVGEVAADFPDTPASSIASSPLHSLESSGFAPERRDPLIFPDSALAHAKRLCDERWFSTTAKKVALHKFLQNGAYTDFTISAETAEVYNAAGITDVDDRRDAYRYLKQWADANRKKVAAVVPLALVDTSAKLHCFTFGAPPQEPATCRTYSDVSTMFRGRTTVDAAYRKFCDPGALPVGPHDVLSAALESVRLHALVEKMARVYSGTADQFERHMLSEAQLLRGSRDTDDIMRLMQSLQVDGEFDRYFRIPSRTAQEPVTYGSVLVSGAYPTFKEAFQRGVLTGSLPSAGT